MRFDEKRIHPLKIKYCKLISGDATIQNLCSEVWAFGSSVLGSSQKGFCGNSDLDIAVALRNGDSHSDAAFSVQKEISTIMHAIPGRRGAYDLIWMNDLNKDGTLYANIRKGEQLI